MNKNIILTLIALVFGVFSMSAANVMINVDNAANVKVTARMADPIDVPLENGMNRITDLTSADSPLTIEAKDGATIESVTVNQSNTIFPSGDNKYRIGIEDTGMRVDIVTSGSAAAETFLTLRFMATGEGVTGKPYTVTYLKDGDWISPQSPSWSSDYYMIPAGATVKVSPEGPYVIEKILSGYNATDPEFTSEKLSDGSVTFINTASEFGMVNVLMSLDTTAIRYSISVDTPTNIKAFLRNGSANEEDFTYLTIYQGVNNFVCKSENLPIQFEPVQGATILSVKNNDNIVNPNYNHQYILGIENNDAFKIETQGKEVDVKIMAATDNPELGNYNFVLTDGTALDVTGTEKTIKLHVGDKVNVSAKPGYLLTYLYKQNAGTTDYLSYFIVGENEYGPDPMNVIVYGEKYNKIYINVDDSSRILVKTEGGRGDILALQNGENIFEMDYIVPALAVSSTPGNQISTVTLNNNAVSANAQSVYLLDVKVGDKINIISRQSPVEVEVTFNLSEDASLSWLTAKIDDVETAVTDPMYLDTYSTMSLNAVPGYVLDNVTTDQEGVSIVRNVGTKGYDITVNNAAVTSLELNVTLSELIPQEGNTIVIPTTIPAEDAIFFRFWEMTTEPVEGRTPDAQGYYYVSTLAANTGNEIKSSNYVRIYNSDSQSRFKSIKLNGEPIGFDENANMHYVKISERTVIEVEKWTPIQFHTQETYDETKLVKSGEVFIEADGELVNNLTVVEGQQIKLVGIPEKGYVLDHIERFYTMEVEGTTVDADYTVTAQDAMSSTVMFKGVFVADENAKSFVVRGQKAWAYNEEDTENNGFKAVGDVGIEYPDGSIHREYVALEGEELQLYVLGDEEMFNTYEVDHYCLMSEFPDGVIPGSKYTVKADDANEDGVIWITAVLKDKESGIGEIADTTLNYNPEIQTVSANGRIEIYDLTGRKVATGEDEVSVSSLPAGAYIAISGAGTLKFVK